MIIETQALLAKDSIAEDDRGISELNNCTVLGESSENTAKGKASGAYEMFLMCAYAACGAKAQNQSSFLINFCLAFELFLCSSATAAAVATSSSCTAAFAEILSCFLVFQGVSRTCYGSQSVEHESIPLAHRSSAVSEYGLGNHVVSDQPSSTSKETGTKIDSDHIPSPHGIGPKGLLCWSKGGVVTDQPSSTSREAQTKLYSVLNPVPLCNSSGRSF